MRIVGCDAIMCCISCGIGTFSLARLLQGKAYKFKMLYLGKCLTLELFPGDDNTASDHACSAPPSEHPRRIPKASN